MNLKSKFKTKILSSININNFNFIHLDSKIGRQTNLFKQNLISSIDTINHESSNDTNSQMITDFDLNNLPDIEDSLDFNTSQFIKTINDSYKKSFEVTIFIYTF